MKTISKYILAGLVLSTAAGCKDRMVEFNSNPDVVSVTKPEYQFTKATEKFDYRTRNAIETKYLGVMQLMQYVSAYGDGNPYVDPTLPDSKTPGSFPEYYNQFFNSGGTGNYLASLIREINGMSDIDQNRYDDIRAISKVVYAFQQWRILSQYGAMVYSEAFKAQTEAINQPKYELGKDIYKKIDQTFKEAITVLSADAHPTAQSLGANDYFFGYYNDKGTVKRITDANVQRTNWLRFANLARLEMAWQLRKSDPAFFETVKTEFLAVTNGYMTKIEEGAYYNYASDYDDNPDDVDVVSQNYAISNTLLSVLKTTNDPRLQYLARPNGVSSVNSFNYRVIKQLFPDSLSKYGEILQEGNIFQGQVSNPRFQNQRPFPVGSETAKNPNFVGLLTMSFILPNTNYPNDSLVYVDPTGKKIKVCGKEDKTFTLSVQLASPAQGRYFVKGGGKKDKNGNLSIGSNVNSLRFDGPGVNDGAEALRLRRPIFTYAKQCFMFAHLGMTVGGKAPLDWYKEGIKSAMVELRDDAIRYGIQVATSDNYPSFPGYNPNGKYTYSDADIDAYVAARVAAPGFDVTADAINQAWIYFYQMPETAYTWWKITGLPEFKRHNTPAEVKANVKNAYLESPFKNSADIEPLIYPRRACLPNRTTNSDNFLVIQKTLEASAGFGEWSHTNGRVWFDVE